MKKTLLLLVFIFTCAFTYNVNAATLTPRSALDSYSNNNVFDTTGIADADQRPQENFTYSSTLNTTYSRKLYGLRAYFNYSLTANHTYRLSIYTALNNFNWSAFNYADLRICYGSSWSGANSNCTSNLGYSILSSDTIAFNFRPTSNYTYFSFRIGPQTMKEYPLTSTFNYRITSFTIDDLNGPVNNPTNQDVINNDNQNTQTILDKQQSDTSTIINGQYQREQEILEHQRQMEQNIIDNQNANSNSINNTISDNLNTCKEQRIKFTLYRTGYLGDNGQYLSNPYFFISDYVEIVPDLPYKFDIYSTNNNAIQYGDWCWYDENKELIDCDRLNQGTNDTVYIFSKNAKYIRTTLYKSQAVLNNAYIEGVICTNKIDGIQNYISDGNVSSSTGQNFFGNFQVDDFGISAIISAPLNAISTLTSATCSPLIIPIPFTNSTISLPCMTSIYQSKVPELYQLWQIVSFGIISYYIINSIYGMIHNFREPDNDCLEVLDL